MTRMGHYQSAQTYFQQLLKESGNENLAHIHNQLGLTYQAKAEFDQAMCHFNTAYRLMRESRLPLLQDSAHVLRNMSHVFDGTRAL
jgi:tetratricopeptide (TPR) repeat protein